MRKVLSVGSQRRELPGEYRDWGVVRLDIDPACEPDILADAREMGALDKGVFDAVYCAHTLEHFHRHEVGWVLAGFRHVLKPGGFAQVIVPDLGELCRIVAREGFDADSPLYESPLGPVAVADVIYGLGSKIEAMGEGWWEHKNGFTRGSLGRTLRSGGFSPVYIKEEGELIELHALAFLGAPDRQQQEMFELP